MPSNGMWLITNPVQGNRTSYFRGIKQFKNAFNAIDV
jgi:hypothetical protein